MGKKEIGAAPLRLYGASHCKQVLREHTPDGNCQIHIVFSSTVTVREMEGYVDKLSELAGHGLPVPAVIHADVTHRELWLEDLGPVTLANVLQDPTPDLRRAALTAVWATVSALPHLTLSLPLPVLDASAAYRRLLFAVSALARLARIEVNRAVWREAERLCTRVGQLSRCLSHNDIHPGNLIWHNRRCWLVDLDNLCLAPVHYDLVSLLGDAKYQLTTAERGELMQRAHETYRETGLCAASPDEFRAECTLVAAFRHLYVAGSYAELGGVIQAYLPDTLDRAGRALADRGFPHLMQLVQQVHQAVDKA